MTTDKPLDSDDPNPHEYSWSDVPEDAVRRFAEEGLAPAMVEAGRRGLERRHGVPF
jgi:hypothetical protein